MDKIRLLELLLKYRDKDFINRIVNVNDFPILENRDGTVSTHSMSYGEVDGKFYVFPKVVNEGGKAMRLGPDTAWTRALTSGDFIEFDNEQDAADFSKEYKAFMPLFESSRDEFPKRETIWKDLNTGPGTISTDDLGD